MSGQVLELPLSYINIVQTQWPNLERTWHYIIQLEVEVVEAFLNCTGPHRHHLVLPSAEFCPFLQYLSLSIVE